MPIKIVPTVGRIVHFYPAANVKQSRFPAGSAFAAVVASVHDGGKAVNLCVFDADGSPHAIANVPLIQEGDKAPDSGYYAVWMPFQLKDAADRAAAQTLRQLPPVSSQVSGK